MSNNSIYPQKHRKNESKLQVHLEALIDMHQQGYSLVMMQEYLASFGISINTSTIWRYMKKRITRQAGHSISIHRIQSSNAHSTKVELSKALNYQQNSTDNVLQKSTLEKLNDLSNLENEF